MLLSEAIPGVGCHQPSSPRTQVDFAVDLRAVACCLKQPLMVIIIMVIFAISDNFLVWGIHLSLTVKHLHKASRTGALQSHLVIDPLPRGVQNPSLVFLSKAAG